MNFTNNVVCSYVNQTPTSFGDPMTDISFEFFPPKTVTAAFSLQRPQKDCQCLRHILNLLPVVKIRPKLYIPWLR